MLEFLQGNDLWANIIGGAVAAGLFALVSYFLDLLKQRRKHKILRELTDIMGRAIKHRNSGERLKAAVGDEAKWVREARAIEKEAVEKATELSSTAGSL